MGTSSDSVSRVSGLPALLVRRPVTVLMLFLTLMGTGVLAYLRIPLTLLPRGLSESTLTVNLPYPGAGPAEVEDQLARPVEEALRTVSGVSEIVTISSENNASVRVSFGDGADMDDAYADVRERIERIRPRLPPEMDRYTIWRWNSNTDMPVMWIGVQYDADAEDPFGPLERVAVPRLEGVDGVARVGLNGVVDEAVRIFVDFEKVLGYGIDLGQVIGRLRADNFTLPAGRIDDGERTFALRVDTRFAGVEDIERYPLGNGLVLGDIAEVVRARAYRDTVWRVNGRAAVGMDISRESDENTIAVCERLEAVIAELQDDPRLDGVTFNVFWNQKDEILAAIHSLQSSALWGGLFAVLVLWFFLRDLRLTLLAALAIPSSLLVAVMAVSSGGGTLNLISLAGFTLGIGMLVDNAVVVIENISRKRAEGLSRLDAAGRGAGEVGLAVLTATTTSIVVFLPLVFMDGNRNMRIMMREVGLPISYSLAASLLVALVFLPTFTARLMRGSGGAVGSRPRTGRLVRGYQAAVAWILGHRFAATLLLLLVVFATQQAGENLRSAQSGGDGPSGVRIEIEVPATYTLVETNGVFRHFEEWAESRKEQDGFDFYSSRFDRRGGRLQVYARDDLPQTEREKLPDRLRENLPELPGVEATVGRDGGQGASREIRVNLHGRDFGVLAGLADDLAERLAALTTEGEDGRPVPLLENVRTDLADGLDEVHVVVDRERAGDLGVRPERLRGMVAWGLGGQRLPDLVQDEREIRVQIEYARSEEESLLFLRNLGVPSTGGGLVPLASIARLQYGKAAGSLVRRDGRTSTGVTATPNVDDVYLVSRAVQGVLDQFPFPDGTSWDEEGGRRALEEDFAELQKTLLFSVVLVYLLMAILLESVVLPLSILVSIPLALMGVNATLFVLDRARDPMVVVGMILLAGVVVNNAIVLLDRVQRLRAEGHGRSAALVQGGTDRLRPIVMTALTTIFGLLPMAAPRWFPGENQDSGYESMAITVAGGLAFSTFFTLLVVPLFYTFFDDVERLLASFSPWRARDGSPPARGRTPALPAPEPSPERVPAGATSAAGAVLAPRE